MDSFTTWVNLGLILLFVAGNAFFVGSEIAISSARRSRIKQMADMGNKSAKTVEMLHNEPERFYSVTQVGITLVSLGLGAIGMETISNLTDSSFVSLFALFGDSEALTKAAHTTSYAFAFVVISFLHVVAGELAPKVLAFHKAEAISLAVGWIVNWMYIIFNPLIYFMKLASNGLLWIFGQRDLAHGGEGHFTMSVEEIRMVLTASEKDGVLAPEETQMIQGVFNLDEHTVREAMVPRTEILALSKDASLADALRLFREMPHARFPIFDQTIDQIIGIVSIKELLSVMAESTGETLEQVSQRPVSEFAKPPLVVPDSKLVSEMLKQFKKTRQQIAIVIDEYGGTEGLISLEDILEEIVGDYGDEFSHQVRQVKKLEGSQYEVDASMRLSELGPIIGYVFDTNKDYVTLAGLIYDVCGRVPEVGETVDIPSARIVILEMDHHRITRVRFEDIALNDSGEIILAESKSAAEPE
ncbi:MAG: HlyC/CorC family transporter [Dechloromonas sp.]|nr:HlyC/CorC family transporter [Dechloromonas sp.]